MLYFIHGLNGRAASWTGVIEYFTKHGFDCRAVELKEGLNLQETSVMDYVNKVCSVVSKDDVIIGHSMGGLIMQKVAELTEIKAGIGICPAPPADIKMKGISWWRQLRYIPHVLFNIPFKPSFGLVKDIFLNDMSEQTQKQIYKQLQKQSVHVTMETMKQKITVDEQSISSPLYIIGRRRDKTIPVDVIKKIAHKYNAEYDLVEGNHYIFIDWKPVAEKALSFIQQIDTME